MSSSSSSHETAPAAAHSLFSSSRRVYLPGSRPDLRVPMREITLSQTRLPNGTEVPNEPVRVYDTSGHWGDAEFHGDATRGLPPVRATWIRERADVEETAGRPLLPIDDGYLSETHRTKAEAEGRRNPMKVFDRSTRPILRAKAGQCVTQLHYARAGIITPEMEFIAIRENTKLQRSRELLEMTGQKSNGKGRFQTRYPQKAGGR